MEKLSVVLAMDSFKGSVSALQACQAIGAGLVDAGKSLGVSVHVDFVPVSDGGEGLLQCLSPVLTQKGYKLQSFPVFAPYGDIHEAQVLVSANSAIVESAEAIGLELTPAAKRDGFSASTYGLGQLISKLLASGVCEFDIGLGGSATNDCGIGMAQALGVKFFDAQGRDLGLNADGSLHRLCGADLIKIAKFDDCVLQARLAQVGAKFVGSCDVDNPLCGPEGATYVFGGQKGLNKDAQAALEQGMQHFAQVLVQHYGQDLSTVPGSGAAGGLGAALRFFFNGRSCLLPGLDMVLDAYKFEHLLQNCDLVIVGEGCMDGQSIHGKAPVGVARRAARAHIPCMAVCGALKDDASALYAEGINAMFAIANGPMSLEESKEHAAALLYQAALNVMRCFLSGRFSSQRPV